jgi:hypothetical protein
MSLRDDPEYPEKSSLSLGLAQEAYAKTQRIQQKLQGQESSAADLMPLDVESDVNSEEEV